MRNRTESMRQALRDSAAVFLAREAGHQSLITVTRAELSPDLSRATLYLSVLPLEKAEAALGFLKRTIPELKDYLKEHTTLPRIPHLEFLLEPSAELL